MRERPILFSAPMVCAMISGQKTMTRRICKVPPGYVMDEREDGRVWPMYVADVTDSDEDAALPCPYGRPGDRLWVREAWRTVESLDDLRPSMLEDYVPVHYEADDTAIGTFREPRGRKRPGMFMPRAFSRITLEVTGVRVERLHAITEEDAIAEGCGRPFEESRAIGRTPRDEYAALWREINGTESWNANPWVWVVSFKRIEAQERAA